MKYLTILLAAFVAGALGAPKNGATTKATGYVPFTFITLVPATHTTLLHP